MQRFFERVARTAFLALVLSVQLWAPRSARAAAEKLENADCLDCHTDADNFKRVNGKSVALPAFPTNDFNRSVHAHLQCVDCHQGIKEMQHSSDVPPAVCTGCHDAQPNHEQAAKDYASSIHGASHALGASGAASCVDCHGSHDILGVKDPASPVFKLNLPRPARSATATPA